MLEAEIDLGTLVNNRYQIQKLLGQGGFGRTYLATDTERFDELCVLKEFVPSSKTHSTAQRSRELFGREARVLYQINHPQIPKFLAWFEYAGCLFLVQQYIDGKTYSSLLSDRLAQQGQALSEMEIVQWLRDLLPVLAYLHRQNIVHRDISPDNVMLPHGQSKPVLIDFGLVKQTVSQMWALSSDTVGSAQLSFVGKVGYSPSEQMRLGKCYPCSDLYALGVTAIVLLTGREPNWLMDQNSLEWEWHSYVQVSDRLAQTLDKMLAEKPKDRYQSAQEVLAHLPLPAAPGVLPGMPFAELQIEVDQTRIAQEVAEIEESDFFQQLQQQAEQLRNIESVAPQTESELPSTLIETVSWPNSNVEAEPATTEIDPAFINLCQQELARYLGRMASYVLTETLEENPHLSPQQLVEALATEISNPQQAREFRNSITANQSAAGTPKSGRSQRKPTVSPSPESIMVNPAEQKITTHPQLTKEFIDRCQHELARCIGPMASYIVEETLDQSELSPQQLVEALAAEISNSRQAAEFRQRLTL